MPVPDDPLAATVSELSNVVLGQRPLADALATVVRLARSTVPGVDGVSVSLRQDGRLTTSSATDDVVRELDAVQHQDGAGPCVDAIDEARQVSLSPAAERDRYPRFSVAAEQRFITGVLSTPLAVGDRVLGALNFYSASVDRFGRGELETTAQFARHASTLLANASTIEAATTTNEQLRQALSSRDLIGQAKGILMERFGCSADEAFDRLRLASQQENRKLISIAEEVVVVGEGRRSGRG